MKTDHAEAIHRMRAQAEMMGGHDRALELQAAAAILEVHDATGLSLDSWTPVRRWIENILECPITENGA